MTLPQFAVETFPGQLLWLLFAAGISYLFNKKIFLSSVSNNVSKRNEIIQDYIEERNKAEKDIENLKSDIDFLVKKSQVEVKSIIEAATSQSQAMLFEYGQKKHHFL